MWDDDKSDWKFARRNNDGYEIDVHGYDKYGLHRGDGTGWQSSNSYSTPSHSSSSSASDSGLGALIVLGIGGFILYKICKFIEANWVSIVTIIGICVACVITCIIISKKAEKPGLKTFFAIASSIGLIVAMLYFGPGKIFGIIDALVDKIKNGNIGGMAIMSLPILTIFGIAVACVVAGIVILKKLKSKKDRIKAQAVCERGIQYHEKNDYDRAIKEFTKAIRLDPNNALAYAKRGTCYYDTDQYDLSSKDFSKVIGFDPNNDWAYASRGEACCRKGQFDQAMSDCTEAIRLNPDNALAYSTRGGAYYNKKEYDQAIKNFDEAIRLNPNLIFAHGMRGEAYRMKGQHEQAISDYTEAIRLAPNNAEIYATRGATYWWEKGERDQAVSDASMALELDPNNDLAKAVLQNISGELPNN